MPLTTVAWPVHSYRCLCYCCCHCLYRRYSFFVLFSRLESHCCIPLYLDSIDNICPCCCFCPLLLSLPVVVFVAAISIIVTQVVASQFILIPLTTVARPVRTLVTFFIVSCVSVGVPVAGIEFRLLLITITAHPPS